MGDYDDQILNIREMNMDNIYPSHSNNLNLDVGGHVIVVIGKRGCFYKGTRVLMSSGDTVAMENLRCGDYVMGDDNTPRKVLELYRGTDKMYEIRKKFETDEEGGGQDEEGNKEISAMMYYESVKKASKKAGEEFFQEEFSGGDFSKPDRKTVSPSSYIVNQFHKLVFLYRESFYEMSVSNFLKQPAEFKDGARLIKAPVAFPCAMTLLPPKEIGRNLSADILNKQFSGLHLLRSCLINSFENRMELINELLFYLSNEIDAEHFPEDFTEDLIFLFSSVGMRVIEKRNRKLFVNTSRESYKEGFPFRVFFHSYSPYYGILVDKNHRFLLASLDVVRNSGKTALLANLLYAKRNVIPTGVIISETECVKPVFSKFFPSTFIYHRYDEKPILKLKERQHLSISKLKNPWSLLLLDDCLSTKKIFNTELQKQLFKLGRHWAMLYVFTSQFCMDIPPDLRNNIDGLFIFAEDDIGVREKLHNHYMGFIPKEIFIDLMDWLGRKENKYTCFYVDKARQGEWHEKIFWFKPKHIDDLPSFRFGSADTWKFHNMRKE